MKPVASISDRRFASLKPAQPFYGAPVGILVFERPQAPFIRPFVPGSVGNASTWSVPVRYKAVPGLKFDQLLGPNAEEMTSAVIQAARKLTRDGAQLITSNCGFMIRYQEAVRAALEVPVLLSSLLLAPFLERMLPRGKALGIITASAPSLTQLLLEAAGLSANFDRVVVAGLEHAPSFASAWITCSDHLDVSAVETETVEAAVALLADRPDIGMLLLECSELPPFAAAVQRATGVPVFDFTSMVEFFVSGLIRKPFNGIY
ncbi:hypothetical protein OWC48_44500 [Bradyrhizobium sp. Arg816]|nr:hypothetical protein [Bradyrhizobium sp. Arg816]